jgi:hypothetical protein
VTTRLFFRPTTSVVSGTLPSGEQSAQTPTVTATGGTTNRSLSLGFGSATGTNLTATTSASTSRQFALMGMFISDPLLGTGTVGGGSMIFGAGEQESNLAANAWMNGLELYVWRPSTGSKVGTIKAFTASLGGTEPTSAAATQTTYITGITSSGVSYQDGDLIVGEVWSDITQGMSTAYTVGLYYDGATAISSENASNTAPASFIEFSEDVNFKSDGFSPTDRYIAATLSNSNRTLTGDGSTSQYETARAAVSRSTGKLYLEGKVDSNGGLGAGNQCAVGLSGLALALNVSGTLTNWTGSNTTSWGLYDDAKVYTNSATSATTSLTATAGNWVRMAVDFDAGKVWVGDATSWHNSGDPAAGTNPTFTFTANTQLWVSSSVRGSGAVTINLGTAAWSIGSLPSGYSAWYAGNTTASASQTLSNITQTATVTTRAAVSANHTLSNLTQSATLTATAVASASQTLSNVTQVATIVGNTTSSATANQTLSNVTQTATLTARATASASHTLDNVTQTATATARVSASSTVTLSNVTQAATATARAAASSSVTLSSPTQVATAQVTGSAQASQTLSSVTQTATLATVSLSQASSNVTLSNVTQTATAVVVAQASANQTLSNVSQTATSATLGQAGATQVLGAVTQTAALAALASISSSQTLQAITNAATAIAKAQLSAAQELGQVTQTATLIVPVSVEGAQVLGEFTNDSQVAAIGKATAVQTLGDVTQDATAVALVQAQADQQLEAISVSGSATALVVLEATQTLPGFVNDCLMFVIDPAKYAFEKQWSARVPVSVTSATVPVKSTSAQVPIGKQDAVVPARISEVSL